MFLDVGDDFAVVGDEGSPLVYVRLGVPDSEKKLRPPTLFSAIVFCLAGLWDKPELSVSSCLPNMTFRGPKKGE